MQNNSKFNLKKNKQCLAANPSMKKHLGKIFEELRTNDLAQCAAAQNNLEELRNKNAPEKESKSMEEEVLKLEERVFSPDKFKYSRFQSIVSKSKIPADKVDKIREAKLKDVATKEKLQLEQKIVSDTLAHYRYLAEESKKSSHS